jgi:hypothetical protein
MKKERPDIVVYSEEKGYHASKLEYSTSVGAPAIKMDNVVSWKSRGIQNVNKEFEHKFNELKQEYEKLIDEFRWNELVYSAKFLFEPVIGETYHLYLDDEDIHFLSLISPQEWNKKYVATFKLNSDKKWILVSK